MNLARRSIKNARLVLALAPKRWPNNLPAPVFAADNDALMRAVSLLRGVPMRDGEPVHAADLTADQARDVVRHCLSPRPSTPSPAATLPAGMDGRFSSESA